MGTEQRSVIPIHNLYFQPVTLEKGEVLGYIEKVEVV